METLQVLRAALVGKENQDQIRRAEREYKNGLDTIEYWSRGTQWSQRGMYMNVRYEALHRHTRANLNDSTLLNSGGFGTVSSVRLPNVLVADKTISLRRLTAEQRRHVTEEGAIAERLEHHRHIVRLVGTYWKNYNPSDPSSDPSTGEFHILTFPVATCDLGQLLSDCEEVSVPWHSSPADMPELLTRLVSMGFHVTSAGSSLRAEIIARLRSTLGCLTEGLRWIHKKGIQHRDIKPANILLRPGQILYTDFGLSRDRLKSDRTTTEQHVGFSLGYAAPEILREEAYNPRFADVYSLGCVFLHILTVMHGPNVSLLTPETKHLQHLNRHYTRERCFKAFLHSAQPFERHHMFIPDNVVEEVLAPMLQDEAGRRPSIEVVANILSYVDDGELAYYGDCCRERFVKSWGIEVWRPSEPAGVAQ